MSDDVYRTKFTRRITWDEDIMKVSDSVTDVWNDAVSNIRDGLDKQMENAVCNHFDIDMSDLRAYMHDKIAWMRKQELAIPRWRKVPEEIPYGEQAEKGVLAYYNDGMESRLVPVTFHPKSGWWDCLFNKPIEHITHWMPLPEPPKGEGDEQSVSE